MKRFLPVFFLASLLAFSSCSNKERVTPDDDSSLTASNIIVPTSLECAHAAEITFSVRKGEIIRTSDKVVLKGNSTFTLPVVSVVEGESFTFALDEDVISDRYSVYLERNGKEYFCGIIELTVLSGVPVEPVGDATVYGLVEAGGRPVGGVVISDGYQVVVTDDNGIYQMKSEKKHKYVFISVPSGYEVPVNGILPLLHKQLRQPASIPERIDFQLISSSNQDNHTILVLGDIHLANRSTGDRRQFAEFVKDVNAFLATNTAKKTYAITLGDMTWDSYWKSNNFGYAEYLIDAGGIKNLPVFHTIGNHDHSMWAEGDFDTVSDYKVLIAPTYYSFNIGKVHYVVLDNIECTNSNLTADGASRSYKSKVVKEQLDWLKKDLSYVSKSTPLFITMHAPLLNQLGALSMDDANDFIQIVKDWDQVQLFTGHTHRMYNIDDLSETHVFEHNAGAVCATWWWSDYQTPGIHIATDGAPGGYSIVNVTGTSFNWQFKGTGRDISHQFRSYDRNQIHLTTAAYTPNADSDHMSTFAEAAKHWSSTSTDNYVYINVWNYDPLWKVQVSENSAPLEVSAVVVKDPLHLISYTAPRCDKNGAVTFATTDNYHTFRVKASSPSTTLNIRVTDRFGNVYNETMTRPKAFNPNTYK